MSSNGAQYLNSVKVRFAKRPRKYQDFLQAMNDFRSQRITIPILFRRVSAILARHEDLFRGFKDLLPSNHGFEHYLQAPSVRSKARACARCLREDSGRWYKNKRGESFCDICHNQPSGSVSPSGESVPSSSSSPQPAKSKPDIVRSLARLSASNRAETFSVPDTCIFENEPGVCSICKPSDSGGPDQAAPPTVTCAKCSVVFHPACYGVDQPSSPWSCDWCSSNPESPPQCCLCPVRGGACKATPDSRWAHVICAAFLQPSASEAAHVAVANVPSIPPDSWNKTTCYVCRRCDGVCVNCSHAGCDKAFHAQCARMDGLTLISTPPNPFRAYCLRHSPDSPDS